MPFQFPVPRYSAHLRLTKPQTLLGLCEQALVPCRASGEWTQRKVGVVCGDALQIEAEPGYLGAVRITVPSTECDPVDRARLALGALAYGLFDGVARATVAGQSWAKPAKPAGRPKTGRALTTAERQRRFRERRRDRAE